MLWPSSMFWMLLATASSVVPSTQPALPLLAPIASRGDLEASLKRDSALDVCPVIFTARILDVAADRLQLASERLEVRIAAMGVFGYVCDGHRRLTDIQATWRAVGIRLRQHRGHVRSWWWSQSVGYRWWVRVAVRPGSSRSRPRSSSAAPS